MKDVEIEQDDCRMLLRQAGPDAMEMTTFWGRAASEKLRTTLFWSAENVAILRDACDAFLQARQEA